jgi:cation/acetate symporter
VSTGLLIAGPAIWVDILGHSKPLFDSNYPTLIAMPLAFAACWIVSLLDGARHASEHRERFDEIATRALAGEGGGERGA